jgi:GT2 family glycosyltransferase
MAKCSYIVSVYKNTQALQLILFALAQQSELDFELIIAEDGENLEMKEFLAASIPKYNFPILHLTQKDEGFLKCKMLNKAIAASSSPYLIFTDGDCVPHRHFIKQHLASATINYAMFGRRVMLSEEFTRLVYENAKLLFQPFLFYRLVKYKCTELIAGIYLPSISPKKKIGIWGCNWAVHKQAMIDVDGFDEDYNMAGYGEDRDIEWRLLRKGMQCRQIKHRVIQYHLWHKVNYNDTLIMKQMMMDKMDAVAIIPSFSGNGQLREMESIFK